MGTIVYTESECDACHKKHREKGGDTFPPVGWARATSTFRRDGSGWTNNDRYEATLCPDCAQKVLVILAKGD